MTLAGDTPSTLSGVEPASEARTPVRTCVGCRQARPQAALLRFGRRADGQVVPANARDHHGRSAYVCPRRACLDQALKRRAFTRAFGAGRQRVGVVDVDADALWSATTDQIRREIDLLGRTSLNPQAHPRRRGLEQLLSELSSQPHAPEMTRGRQRGPASQAAGSPATDETTRREPPSPREGGAPSHG